MRGRFLRAAVGALAILIVALLAWRWLNGAAPNHEPGENVPTAARARLVGDEVRVSIASGDLEAAGITLQPLEATTHQERVAGFGTVIAPQALLESQRAYQAAQAEVDRVEASIKAARLEVQRLGPLHRDDRIISDKTLEAARVAVAAEEANLQVARGRLEIQTSTLRQQWGPLLGGWLKDADRAATSLLSGQDLLLKVALPAGRYVASPSGAEIVLPQEAPKSISIVSTVPDTDPKFQGQGFFATTPKDPRLLPGMVVPVSIIVGQPVTGVLVPDSAVVLWLGEKWAFFEAGQGDFALRPVDSDIWAGRGWMVVSGLKPGQRAVVQGAQLLLAEAVRVQGGGATR